MSHQIDCKLVLFIAILLVFAPAEVLACSCSPPTKPPEDEVKNARKRAAVVFAGKLVKIIDAKNSDGTSKGSMEAVFEVSEVWKVELQSKYSVHTTTICCICGFPFREGETYLVYAYEHTPGRFSTNNCTRTNLDESDLTKVDRKYLGKSKKVGSTKGAI